MFFVAFLSAMDKHQARRTTAGQILPSESDSSGVPLLTHSRLSSSAGVGETDLQSKICILLIVLLTQFSV